MDLSIAFTSILQAQDFHFPCSLHAHAAAGQSFSSFVVALSLPPAAFSITFTRWKPFWLMVTLA
jgi:hypothetical protein